MIFLALYLTVAAGLALAGLAEQAVGMVGLLGLFVLVTSGGE